MFLLVLLLAIASVNGQVKHNLPDDVELVDPKSLGFDESQIDLDSLLGNVKLLPISGKRDPITGTKTQVLTVGFEGDENINLDDFELPQNPNGNNTDLVNSAFQEFKDYFKKNKTGDNSQPQSPQPKEISGQKVVMRRRKIIKPSTTTTLRPQNIIKEQETVQKTGPKVVELDSSQIEKLLATGKLKSKKIGDSQVIEITQDQLNQLYQMENGDEFKSLLGDGQGSEIQTQVTQAPLTTFVPVTVTTTKAPMTTTTQDPRPPIIYEFNSKDYDKQIQLQKQQYFLPNQQTQLIYQNSNQNSNQNQQNINYPQQQHKSIKTPTYEFISVPPVSFASTLSKPQLPQQNYVRNNFGTFRPNNFSQDPLPRKQGQIQFPSQQQTSSEINSRYYRDLGMNTFYQGDGLNYLDQSGGKAKQSKLWGI